MTFEEILDQAAAMLQRRGRITYRALQAQFQLDDVLLETLKDELLFSHPVRDKEGRGLEWTGEKGDVPVESQMPDAERRQLTVMFCDLVGSTALAGQMDPEDLRDVVRAYQERAATVIQQYEGHIAQYLGDGLLVYFGWPRAHEDDAQRGVHAGLGIVDAIDALNAELKTTYPVQIAVRVGIHTGQVVIGEMGGGDRHEHLALGDTPNIAARLEGLAQPGTVLMSEATRQLTAGAFDDEDLGTPSLKGVAEAIHVFRVDGVRAVVSRFDASASTLTPLVGREVELDLLMRGWELAVEGEGQVVVLGGPPGMGKSRLVQSLCTRLMNVPHTRLRYQCSPYHTTNAFYPIANQITHAMRVPLDASNSTKLDRLETLMTQADLPLEPSMPLFAKMLSIPVDDRYPPLALNAQRQKERTIEFYTQGLRNLAVGAPVLVIFEDIHWIDPTSLEALRTGQSIIVACCGTAR